MKSKWIKKGLAVSMAISLLSMASCGGTQGGSSEYDQNFTGTTVYMSCYSGGFGSDFIRKASVKFNKEHEQDGYRVVVLPDNKDDMSTINTKVDSKTTNADIFLSSDPNIDYLISKNALMDVTDLYSREVDGMKLSEKIDGLEEWNYALKRNNKYYGIPHNDGLISAVVDYGLLEEKEWLVYDDSGDVSVGKDGKAGTYDDGLPVNVEEWDDMILNIAADGIAPFIYSGKYYFYTNFFFYNLWAQYSGLDNYKLNYTFNGTYIANSDGNETEINDENGYLMYQIDEGRRESVQFMKDYIANPLYTHAACKESGIEHIETQSRFILGHEKAESNQQSAILFDGIWWQNEARPAFDSCAEAKDYGYAYGVHDYRLLLAPNMENGNGIDGEGNGSIVACNENAIIFALKQTDPIKELAIKEWLLYCASDEVSQLYTTLAGGVRPYKYSLTDEQLASLNPFVKSVWEAYSDRENVKIVRNSLMTYTNAMNLKPTPTATPIKQKINGITYENIVESLLLGGKSVNDVCNGFASYYTSEVWADMLSQIK